MLKGLRPVFLKERRVYSKWLGIYYQITPAGRREAGLIKRLISFRSRKHWRSFEQSEVVDYLAQYPRTPRNLQQIYEGVNWQVTRNGLLKAVEALRRKGWIRKVKERR